jgi:hypothetical protein
VGDRFQLKKIAGKADFPIKSDWTLMAFIINRAEKIITGRIGNIEVIPGHIPGNTKPP